MLNDEQIKALELARKVLLEGVDLDLDERSFVAGAIDHAFPELQVALAEGCRYCGKDHTNDPLCTN